MGDLTTEENVPACLQRATVVKLTPDIVLMKGYADMIETPKATSERQALDDLIDQCDPGLQWAVEQYFSKDGGIAFAQSIQNETAIAVSF